MKRTFVLVVLLLASAATHAQEMAFQGKWKLMKDRSSDLDYFQYLTFQFTVNPGEITIVKELGPKRKASETMVLKTNGAINSVSVVDRTFMSNLYMGLKLPSGSKKEVTATWKNNLLVIHERYPVIASQGIKQFEVVPLDIFLNLPGEMPTFKERYMETAR